MKKINAIILGLTLLAGTACKKDKTEDAASPAASVCLITKEVSEDGSYKNFEYSSGNQITSTHTFDSSNSTYTTQILTYSGNKVIVQDSGSSTPSTQTCYLNSKGFADSAHLSIPGFAELNIIYTYNGAFELIKEIVSGDLLGGTIEQVADIEYLNGNKSKITTDDGTNVSVTTFEYYTDKINSMAKSEQALSFTNANKNLIKKQTNNDGTFTNFTYEFDSNGKVTKQIMVDETSAITFTIYSWQCK